MKTRSCFLESKKCFCILYICSELLKIHKNVSHTSSHSLLKLHKLARPWKADNNSRELFIEISIRYNVCQRYAQLPMWLKVSLSLEENLVFNYELSTVLMLFDGKAVFHVVDKATRFSAFTFLNAHNENYGQSVYGARLAFIMIWCTLYTGYINQLGTGQGSTFTSDK